MTVDVVLYLSAIAVGLIGFAVVAWLMVDPEDDRLVLTETFPGEWDLYCRRCGELFVIVFTEQAAREWFDHYSKVGHDCREHRAETRAQHWRDRDEERRDEQGWAA